MIAFLFNLYLLLLFVLVKLKVIKLTLWWKLSPVGVRRAGTPSG